MSRLDRQSFLGKDSDAILKSTTLGLVGLGGGGSHHVQQAAHLGYGGYVLVDPDTIDETNTNRLVGGTLADVKSETAKVAIAARTIRALQPDARIKSIKDSWHNAIDDLKPCDVIIGAVDTFLEREQLERFARRHLIPYVDVGMDVHKLSIGDFFIAGQVILSMPGEPCMRCCGFITDERVGKDANRYGDAGARPQVVWPNGVLASSAIGLATQVVTPWFRATRKFTYLEYDGNTGTLVESRHMRHLAGMPCPHHPAEETGDSLFDIRDFGQTEVREKEVEPPHTWRKWFSDKIRAAVLGRK